MYLFSCFVRFSVVQWQTLSLASITNLKIPKICCFKFLRTILLPVTGTPIFFKLKWCFYHSYKTRTRHITKTNYRGEPKNVYKHTWASCHLTEHHIQTHGAASVLLCGTDRAVPPSGLGGASRARRWEPGASLLMPFYALNKRIAKS